MSAPAVDFSDSLSRLIPSRVARGFFLAVVSGLFFNFLNGAVKELAGEMPPLYVAWGRWIAGIVLIVPYLLWRVGWAGMGTRDMKLHWLRGMFHTPGYGLWRGGGLAAACHHGGAGLHWPDLRHPGAVIFLRETVHWRRWAGVAVGFAGMLVIVRPGLIAMNPGIVMMMIAVPLIAGSNLVAKAVSARDKPAVVVLWQSVVGAICFTPLGIWFWQTPTVTQLGLFLAAGFFGTMGYFFITWAYRLLDISALQSITFLGIVWAALMDVVVWGKTSDIWTFVGAAIIVSSTTYIAHREARAGGRRK
jgi:drug/metabolite transporter (DMT)-like permease